MNNLIAIQFDYEVTDHYTYWTTESIVFFHESIESAYALISDLILKKMQSYVDNDKKYFLNLIKERKIKNFNEDKLYSYFAKNYYINLSIKINDKEISIVHFLDDDSNIDFKLFPLNYKVATIE